VALAAGDFAGDGMDGLVCGYAADDGGYLPDRWHFRERGQIEVAFVPV
jgi:hypothetical protein